MTAGKKDISQIFAEGKLIDAAINKGIAQALRRHKQAGVPIVVCRDGRIVHIPPDQIPVEDEPITKQGK
jgi:hypothetical protein